MQSEVLVEAAQHHLYLLCSSSRLQCICPFSHSLVLAKNFRQLLTHGIRTRANLPPWSIPQICLKPRKSNVSGLSPVFARSTRTNLPKRISRVFSSANSSPNFSNRSVNFFLNSSASLPIENSQRNHRQTLSGTPPLCTLLDLLFEPEIKNVVQIDVSQDRLDYSTNTITNFEFETVLPYKRNRNNILQKN